MHCAGRGRGAGVHRGVSPRPEPNDARATCYRCFKPESMCVCPSIETVDNRTGVFVLQHPRERAHPIGTARFVELGLRRSEVHVAHFVDGAPRARFDVPPGTGLLYPGPDARELGVLTPGPGAALDEASGEPRGLAAASRAPAHLIALDGTWAHARKLYAANPWLQRLPHYRIEPQAPSNYRIRKEPSPSCLSTLESVLAALRLLEPETAGLDGLQRAFDAMVDRQLEQMQRGAGRVHRAPRTRLFRRMPRWLAEEFDSLVMVYAEALPETGVGRMPASQRDLLQLVALRVRSGELFERLVLPRRGVLDEARLESVGLSMSDFDDAIAPHAVGAALDRFVAPGERLAAWNRSTPSLMHEATGLRHRVMLVKPQVSAYASDVVDALDHEGAHVDLRGTLDELATGLGLEGADVPIAARARGRAHERVVNVVRVARWLREQSRRAV